ncbi:MAG: ABC transporter permease [Hyphomicrobiales bacterium]|nr:ABC transporter permease [Hyphomicrobiales bacterium]
MSAASSANAGAPAGKDGSTIPVLVITALILAAWYAACLPMNSNLPQLHNAAGDLMARYQIAWALERPVLPAPHQILIELYNATVNTALFRQTSDGMVLNPRNLSFHAWVTLSATLLGFVIGSVLGIAIAVGIVHSRTLSKSLMPWVIVSQTIPILAIAPIIIVALGSIGLTGLVPKSIISAYLCFFPVTIGMVKGLTSPDTMQLDLMRTYNGSAAQTFWKLRWPAAMPFLFASLKVAITISLVGAIVGELPTGAQAGLGARLLSGSYFGQTIQIWAALFYAAMLAALLVVTITAAERATLRVMGARP